MSNYVKKANGFNKTSQQSQLKQLSLPVEWDIFMVDDIIFNGHALVFSKTETCCLHINSGELTSQRPVPKCSVYVSGYSGKEIDGSVF